MTPPDTPFRLAKMPARHEAVVQYELSGPDGPVDMNALIGRSLSLSFKGRIQCVSCGRLTNKSFNQGHCYRCFSTLASCDRCIMSPELCHYAEGTCREPEWGETNCMRTHVVYLANSSGLKVGITRATQVPTRWMDQGAKQALPILEVPTRHASGLVEAAFRKHVNDRTDWRAMLRGDPAPMSLPGERDRLLDLCADAIDRIEGVRVIDDAEPYEFNYPVQEYPVKVRSMTLDKLPVVEGTLRGIKGQYLILDSGVFNVRRHGGYEVTLEA